MEIKSKVGEEETQLAFTAVQENKSIDNVGQETINEHFTLLLNDYDQDEKLFQINAVS